MMSILDFDNDLSRWLRTANNEIGCLKLGYLPGHVVGCALHDGTLFHWASARSLNVAVVCRI